MRDAAQLLQMLTMRQEHKHTDTYTHTCTHTNAHSHAHALEYTPPNSTPVRSLPLTCALSHHRASSSPLSAALRVAATLWLLLLLLCFGPLLFGHLLHFLCPMRFAFQLISYAQSERVRKRFLHCYCLYFVKQSLLFA